MDYIRRQRSQPDHDPNTHHCLYGADGEHYIIIGASLSEPHTSVYSGTILLCVRTYVCTSTIPHMRLCSKYPTTVCMLSSRAYSSLLALALDFDRANLDAWLTDSKKEEWTAEDTITARVLARRQRSTRRPQRGSSGRERSGANGIERADEREG